MSEKSAPPSAPVDALGFGPPPPPYSPYPPENKDGSAASGVPMYPPLDQQQPTVQPVAQPMVQPVLQQVIVQPPQLTVMGPLSTRLVCPHCRADMNTSVERYPSVAAYVSAAILFLFGCVMGCCLIPFCMDSCKTSEHHCANCKKFIGRYSKY